MHESRRKTFPSALALATREDWTSFYERNERKGLGQEGVINLGLGAIGDIGE